MSGADPIERIHSNNEHIEVEDVEETEYVNGHLYDKVYETAEKFAGTYIGQYVTGKIDRILKLIEDTAKWSLPASNKETNASSIPLERPLPWIPFIALILMLRLIRIALSIAGLFIGNAPLVPSDIVYFIQTRRRKLRAIRIAGMKVIRTKEKTKDKDHGQSTGLLSNLRTIMSVAICRPRRGGDSHNILVDQNSFEEFRNPGVDMIQRNVVSSKYQNAKVENISDHELTLNEILDKYGASSNEDDDSDFIPSCVALNDENSSSTSSSSDTSDEEESNEEQITSTKPKATQSIGNDNPESSAHAHMTNGNSSIEIEDQSMEIKENGEHSGKTFRKPYIMPKPIKDEPMVLPIQDIKQEPAESDDEALTNRIGINNDNSQELKASNDHNLHHQQQSIVAYENDCNESNSKDIAENGADQHNENLNGDKNLQPSGSPDLCGPAFQPISILKNCNAVNLEKRGHVEAFDENEDFIRAEATSRPTKIANHTGKPIKNKVRGKRR